ncbi:FixH family protein [Hyphomicrobium sp.]|uniref:FixH family protein n=1 Tax=Hyphomicrobium sp. TaxID=82 RepID=UPI002FDD7033
MSRLHTAGPRDGRALSGRHVLVAMLAFFGVIATADAVLIYKALSTFGGLDNANAYSQGLAYNERIARAEKQSALGWTETVELQNDPARLRVFLKRTDGAAPALARVDAVLGRPATNREDTAVRLAEIAPGHFEAAVGHDLAPGSWIATVRAFDTETPAAEPVYQVRRRLWIAP